MNKKQMILSNLAQEMRDSAGDFSPTIRKWATEIEKVLVEDEMITGHNHPATIVGKRAILWPAILT